MDLITTTESLYRLCDSLASETFITVDTEFMRESTYWPDLCLIQVAGETVHGLIDPLAPGIDLKPFFALMDNPRVLKVFHAARQDIEIMVHRAGIVPHPVFDTQIAAMVCGFGDQVGYEAIVRKLAKAQIDKSSRFTDWSRRPLSEKQLAYALADVTHLRVVYEALKKELDRTGREHWLREEMDILTNPATYRTEPEDAWKRIKVRLRSKKQLAVLMATAAWREREAREKNVPRSRVLKDDALAEVATQCPQTREALNQLRALPKGMASSRIGDAIQKAVAEGLAIDPKSLPQPADGRDEMSDAAQAAAEVLKLALKVVCEKEGIAPKLVASSSDIDAVAESDTADVHLMHGWRRELFGELALAIKRGEAVIGFEGGKVRVLPAARDVKAAAE
ncbi:ribonuclease D [Aestuariivirga litoralis]|uniref:Ribonuclease D n=1 Tax=Aestuariivirga litoralis TaxID=2650924 RepID=A0A2W2AIX6_9HYPH|nr:ribonuclease D [Aestuariivirga litoralis]PZF75395.1 ribonuclease D [Aestuariivirga litoralis]